jgi:protocatechuate 3,4-dioxygenase, beta subunit
MIERERSRLDPSAYILGRRNCDLMGGHAAMAITILRRRDILAGASAALLVPSLPDLAAARSDLVVTPGQTEGPFYPTNLPADTDADLVRVQGQPAQALGQVAHIAGRVLNRRGEAVRGAQVEIWQCDANGIYHHPSQPGLQRRDSAFQGYGRTEVAADGGYRFRTIRPVAYPGRTPHIHFKVHAPGAGRLTTQMYVAGERQNATDGVLSRIRDARARASVIVRLEAADAIEPGTLTGTFDIVLDL